MNSVSHSVSEQKSVDFLEEISKFVTVSKYARYHEKKKRRETWEENIDRVLDMHLTKYAWLSENYKNKIIKAFDFVKDKKVVPSMRSLQYSGPAVFAHNMKIFNCSVRHIDSLRAFAEVMYVLLCGTGVGLGISKRYLSRLPNLVKEEDKIGTVTTYVVEDTIEGWADSIESLLMCYFHNTPYTGRIIKFDYSKIRKKGMLLKTTGGKAPGPKALQATHRKIKYLLDYIIEELHQDRLEPINAYDILMYEADAVISGMNRKAATDVIFDKDDIYMSLAKTNFKIKKYMGFEKNIKSGKWEGHVTIDDSLEQKRLLTINPKNLYDVKLSEDEYNNLKNNNIIAWYHIEPQRARSNNSVLLMREFLTKEEFSAIIERTKLWGEPGFVFANDDRCLFNPCFEINFIPVTDDGRCGVQVCNLSSINGAMVNTFEDFLDAAEQATIIGTLQAGFTDFKYLSPTSKELSEEEALLGVSITGMMDNPEVLLDPRNQYLAAQLVNKINKEWASIIGINQSARNTCVKPEGTSSLVLKAASGIHPHHGRKYFRRVQMTKNDNVYKWFKKHNPHMCEESVWYENKTEDVITFPIEVSGKSIIKDDLTAIQHLEYIKNTQQNWVIPGTTEVNKKPIHHSVSCTVEVLPEEWDEVVNYLYLNRESFSAVSLLPKTIDDKLYPQSPLERIKTEEDKQKWQDIVDNYVVVDYTQLIEDEDETTLVDNLACAGGACII